MGLGNSINLVAKVTADISSAQKTFGDLQKQVENIKIEPKAASGVTKAFSTLEGAYTNLQNVKQGLSGKGTVQDFSKITTAAEGISKAMKNLQTQMGKMDIADFLPDKTSKEMQQAMRKQAQAVQEYSKATDTGSINITKASLTRQGSKYTEKDFAYFANQRKSLADALKEGDTSKADSVFGGLQSSVRAEIQSLTDEMNTAKAKFQKQQQDINSIFTAQTDSSGKKNAFATYQSEMDLLRQQSPLAGGLSALKQALSGTSEKSQNTNVRGLRKGISTVEAELARGDSADYSVIASAYQSMQANYSGLQQSWNAGGRSRANLRAAGIDPNRLSSIDGALNKTDWQGDLQATQDLASQSATSLFQNLASQIQSNPNLGAALGSSIVNSITSALGADGKGKVSATQVSSLQSAVTTRMGELQGQESSIESGNIDKIQTLQDFGQSISTAYSAATVAIQQARAEAQAASTELGQISEQQAQAGYQAFSGIASQVSNTVSNTQAAVDALKNVSEASVNARQEVQELFSQFARFGTLSGQVGVITNIIKSAYASVKELDEAMNNIAVVTDYTTQDMWDQMNEYTELAQETGSTITGSYQVAQLYYQQGLSDAEVKAATEETLKMARISNIDYSDATDYATAAVKGFGLDYTDLSHVNDVYSNLAAKTAADTEEISIAMSKVASIANSTGMSLENTAAFLTQIIATTREAPETAGTALKTVNQIAA